MKCIVGGCPNNSRRDKHVGYFSFPKDETLLKKWMKFCKLDQKPKAHKVCMEHFEAEQIQGNMKFELGFGKKRYLKKDAVPTIRYPKKKDRLERLDNQKNKKLVDNLIKEYSIGSDPADFSEDSSIQLLGDEIEPEEGVIDEPEPEAEPEEELELNSDIDENGLTDEEEEIEREISEEVVKLDIEMAKAAQLANMDAEIEIEETIAISDTEDNISVCEDETYPVESEEYSLEHRVETLERENKILRQENSLLDARLSSIERRYKYELNELKDKLEKVENDKNVLENELNDIMFGRAIICTQIQQM